jgi:hypothetical protein
MEEKAERPKIAASISSKKAGLSLKYRSFSSNMETPEKADNKAVSSNTNLSSFLSLIQDIAISMAPVARATINPTFIPHISSAIMKTNKGIKPGNSFLNSWA